MEEARMKQQVLSHTAVTEHANRTQFSRSKTLQKTSTSVKGMFRPSTTHPKTTTDKINFNSTGRSDLGFRNLIEKTSPFLDTVNERNLKFDIVNR